MEKKNKGLNSGLPAKELEKQHNKTEKEERIKKSEIALEVLEGVIEVVASIID